MAQSISAYLNGLSSRVVVPGLIGRWSRPSGGRVAGRAALFPSSVLWRAALLMPTPEDARERPTTPSSLLNQRPETTLTKGHVVSGSHANAQKNARGNG